MIQEVPALSPMMVSRKLQALAFIQLDFAKNGEGPSLDEIGRALDCTRQRAQALVRNLDRDGRIHRTPGMRRSIRPLSWDEDALRTLNAAGYALTKPRLHRPFDLDHVPGHGKKSEARRAG